jgi:hypothetical protein
MPAERSPASRTIDEVEISAGAVVTSTTESRDKESTDITNAELALKVARQQSPDATSANAVAKVAKQSATADPTAEGKLPANATTDAEVPLDPMAENSAKTPQRATRVKLATDVPGDKAAQDWLRRLDDLLPEASRTVINQKTEEFFSALRIKNGTYESTTYDQSRNIRKHKIEWHRKIALSFACLVLFLVGAPLGSIIRKGGLGTPMIFAIIFFMVFYFSSTTGEKFAKENTLSPFAGMWMATPANWP